MTNPNPNPNPNPDQVSVKPPTIAIFCNDPELFSLNYRKFLETQMRKSLGFAGTPIRL